MTRLACGQPDWNHSTALCTTNCTNQTDSGTEHSDQEDTDT